MPLGSEPVTSTTPRLCKPRHTEGVSLHPAHGRRGPGKGTGPWEGDRPHSPGKAISPQSGCHTAHSAERESRVKPSRWILLQAPAFLQPWTLICTRHLRPPLGPELLNAPSSGPHGLPAGSRSALASKHRLGGGPFAREQVRHLERPSPDVTQPPPRPHEAGALPAPHPDASPRVHPAAVSVPQNVSSRRQTGEPLFHLLEQFPHCNAPTPGRRPHPNVPEWHLLGTRLQARPSAPSSYQDPQVQGGM